MVIDSIGDKIINFKIETRYISTMQGNTEKSTESKYRKEQKAKLEKYVVREKRLQVNNCLQPNFHPEL